MICISFETILNAIIAIGAIAAAVFAGWAVLQTKKFRQDEEQSRRAFLAPQTNPGHVVFDGIGERGVFINLKNYGVHPATSVRIRIFGYNLTIDYKGEIPPPVFKPYDVFATNPIPHDAEFNVRHKPVTGDFIGDCLVTEFYVMLIDYDDPVLNSHFKDRFYWRPDKNKDLVEVDHDERLKLDQLVGLFLTKEIQTKSETANA